jgi:penicillin-binding protein 1A
MVRAVANRPVEQFETQVPMPDWELDPEEELWGGAGDNSTVPALDEYGQPYAGDPYVYDPEAPLPAAPEQPQYAPPAPIGDQQQPQQPDPRQQRPAPVPPPQPRSEPDDDPFQPRADSPQ